MKLWERVSLKKSLLTKYLLIIMAAMVIFPVSLFVITITFYSFSPHLPPVNTSYKAFHIERMWQQEALSLHEADEALIRQKLVAIRTNYPEAAVYFVNAEGETRVLIPEDTEVPARWSAIYTVEFMKSRYGGDPFTTVAFIGNDPAQGFIVFQISRSFLEPASVSDASSTYFVFGGTALVLIIFLVLSWIFFYQVRKRLLQLQKAMTMPNEAGIPNRIAIVNNDEIGLVETAFNDMIHLLLKSRQREKEEEKLRQQLISNLSHDLRTPLTAMRGHAYRLKQEPLSNEGQQSLQMIDRKIDYIDRLIDNLLSYTLLSAGKYPYQPQKTDIVRLIRASVAGWYPVFEIEGYTIEIDLPEHPVIWHTDPQWLERILDNLLQNVFRHAGTGKYVGIFVAEKENGLCSIMIEDRGPGMGVTSSGKGAGIGLSIVSLMLKEMNLTWDMDALEQGTRVTIKPI